MSKHPVVRINVLAKTVENAKQILEATDGKAFIGIMVKGFATVDEATTSVESFQNEQIPVSVGLGAGDATQWQKVVEVATRTKPAHVNQIFPASAYTIASLQAVGATNTLVNALIKPSGVPGKVIIATGPQSQNFEDMISCDAAAAMLAEMGVHSVKFFPVEGMNHLDEIEEMAKAAVRQGVTIFEPTGGIGIENIGRVADVCLEAGAQQVIPHIYTSIVDKETGLTRIEDIKQLVDALPRL